MTSRGVAATSVSALTPTRFGLSIRHPTLRPAPAITFRCHPTMTRFLLPLLALFAAPGFLVAAEPPLEPADFLLPDQSVMTPFKDRVPILFVTRNQPEWT